MATDFPKIALRLALNGKGCENLCNPFLDGLEKQHKLFKKEVQESF